MIDVTKGQLACDALLRINAMDLIGRYSNLWHNILGTFRPLKVAP